MITPRQLREHYDRGDNITELLKRHSEVNQNTEHIIEVAYDLQTGSYIRAMQDAKYASDKRRYVAAIAEVIANLGNFDTVMEAGVGEATTLSGVLGELGPDYQAFGFDLSWSRVAAARRWLQESGIEDVRLCTGSLLNIPFADNSIDVVYTAHSIEPNGGREAEILSALYRVARCFVVLLEPGYEWASAEAKNRMDSHGYCKHLGQISSDLGYEVIRHEPFTVSLNPMNPTGLTVLRKQTINSSDRSADVFACPRWKTPLRDLGEVYYSDEGLMAYPVIGGIPCLRVENGILASQLPVVALQQQ